LAAKSGLENTNDPELLMAVESAECFGAEPAWSDDRHPLSTNAVITPSASKILVLLGGIIVYHLSFIKRAAQRSQIQIQIFRL